MRLRTDGVPACQHHRPVGAAGVLPRSAGMGRPDRLLHRTTTIKRTGFRCPPMRVALTVCLLMLAVPAQAQGPEIPNPPVVVPDGETMEVQATCTGDALVQSATAILVQGTLRAVQGDCPSPTTPRAPPGASLVLVAPEVVLDGGTLEAADGFSGAFLDSSVGLRMGQDGGRGGDVRIDAERYDLVGIIVLGAGGDGGELAANFAPGSAVDARGGHGGDGGRLLLDSTADRAEVVTAGGAAGDGGDVSVKMIALGTAGSPGVSVTATGGRGGNASADVPQAPGGDGGAAHAVAAGGKRGGSVDNETWRPDGGDGGDATATGGAGGLPGGRGGNATALAGDGGHGADVVVAPCADGARAAGHGGDGGHAMALAGQDDGAAPHRTEAVAGRGGDGGDDTRNGGGGGDGGASGGAEAIGAGVRDETPAGGGDGGDARGTPGVGGDGVPPGADGAVFAGDVDCSDGGPSDPWAEPQEREGKKSPAVVWPLGVVAVAFLARRR